jgi:CheY-like chemotaxis protein
MMNKILIADDDPAGRELLHELLEADGYEVADACNGQEALELIRRSRPDLALLDIDMPELDGFATVRGIREQPDLASLPIAAVTAHAMDGDRERIQKAGFSGYVAKPIHAAALRREIRRLLDMRQQQG